MPCSGAKGPFKLQRLQIGHKTHVPKRGKRRDHTNLIFLKRGNATKDEVDVNCLWPHFYLFTPTPLFLIPPSFPDLIKVQWKGAPHSLRNPVMTNRNTKHDLPPIGNGSTVEEKIAVGGGGRDNWIKAEGRQINLSIDKSVEQRQLARERSFSHH